MFNTKAWEYTIVQDDSTRFGLCNWWWDEYSLHKNCLAHKSKPGAPQALPSARAVSAVHSSNNWSNIATNYVCKWNKKH